MTRFHDLDALRAFAMMLGVVLHSGMFLIDFESWPAQDRYIAASEIDENPYNFLIPAIHGFRMQAFFLISGFFTAMMWRSRGLQYLLRNRAMRIGLPLSICLLTVVPITGWLFKGSSFDPLSWPWAWTDGFGHLWFLWYLLLLAASFAAAARLGLTFRHSLWWFLIPLAVALEFSMQQQEFGADSDEGVVPAFRLLVYYGIFYAFGAFMHQRKVEMRRWWAFALPPALLLVYPLGLAFVYLEDFPASNWALGPAVSAALQVAYAWLMCFGLIGLFRCFAAKERFWVRYMSDASYWMYLWHLPLVLAGQRLLVDTSLNAHLKFALIVAAVIAMTLVSYRYGVRYTAIGTMLNGARLRRREQPPFG